jgi:long-subunit fatty acid transport protein
MNFLRRLKKKKKFGYFVGHLWNWKNIQYFGFWYQTIFDLCSSVDQRSDTQMKDQSFLKLIKYIFDKQGNPGELISKTPRLFFLSFFQD